MFRLKLTHIYSCKIALNLALTGDVDNNEGLSVYKPYNVYYVSSLCSFLFSVKIFFTNIFFLLGACLTESCRRTRFFIQAHSSWKKTTQPQPNYTRDLYSAKSCDRKQTNIEWDDDDDDDDLWKFACLHKVKQKITIEKSL